MTDKKPNNRSQSNPKFFAYTVVVIAAVVVVITDMPDSSQKSADEIRWSHPIHLMQSFIPHVLIPDTLFVKR